jgi:ATP-dependent DNA ligase
MWPRLDLPIVPPVEPTKARLVRELPRRGLWQFEPEWDGFRCVAFRSGDTVVLQSKTGQPLSRYFPEIVGAVHDLAADRFVLDGEILIPKRRGYAADALRERIHPAEGRVRLLSVEKPAALVVFDLLVDPHGRDLTSLPLSQRRARLEQFAFDDIIRLWPATHDRAKADRWPIVVAKRSTEPYRGQWKRRELSADAKRSASNASAV